MQPLYDSVRELREIIQGERKYGIVTLDLLPLTDPVSHLEASNRIVHHVGFNPPNSWTNIPFLAAQRHLVRCLHRGLAYKTLCIEKERSEELALKFFGMFSGDNQEYFTNTLPWKPSVYERDKESKKSGVVVVGENEVEDLGWGETKGTWASSSLTSSTFDTGIVVVDSTKAGILWFQEED
ncbi:MAG: hypothetical protein ACJ8FY_28190 [Gemmataceae bacterium]